MDGTQLEVSAFAPKNKMYNNNTKKPKPIKNEQLCKEKTLIKIN
jgi:hypothetical protein